MELGHDGDAPEVTAACIFCNYFKLTSVGGQIAASLNLQTCFCISGS